MAIRKRFLAFIFGLAAVSAARGTEASPVTLPNTFSQGSTIRSSEVNGNFSAVKAAVDDNQAQIDGTKAQLDDQKAQIAALEAAKQNKITGSCPAGSSISAVKPDGTVVCQPDANTTYSGAAPIAVSGNVIGLQPGGITNALISPSAAIAVSKIFGDAGIEFSNPVVRVNLPNNSATPTVVSSITLTAPSAGTILLTVNGGVHLSDTHLLASLGIGLSQTAYAVSHSQWADGSSTAILPVSVGAAGSYTFYALANETDPTNAGTSWVTDVQLVGVFIPKRY
jgi:hypothetical protein